MITIDQIRMKLIDAIKTSGKTQTEIAKSIGIRPTQISSYINGRKLPALDTLANLCVVLDVEPNEILCFDDHTHN